MRIVPWRISNYHQSMFRGWSVYSITTYNGVGGTFLLVLWPGTYYFEKFTPCTVIHMLLAGNLPNQCDLASIDVSDYNCNKYDEYWIVFKLFMWIMLFFCIKPIDQRKPFTTENGSESLYSFSAPPPPPPFLPTLWTWSNEVNKRFPDVASRTLWASSTVFHILWLHLIFL